MIASQIVAAFAIAGLSLAMLPAETEAPLFSLNTIDGSTISLEELKGKVVVLNFWATWCGPCRAEIPGFLEVYDRYRKDGLEIIGVSLDEGPESDVEAFVQRSGINYPVGIDHGAIAKLYGGIQSIPTTFFVNRQGRVVQRHLGFMNKAQFERTIKKLL